MGDKKEFTLSAKSVLQTEDNGGVIFCESGGEFVLPDYLPKVQKVLRLEARALPPSKYRSASEAQMSGNVLHSLLYLGEDGEVGATVLPAKYDFSVPLSAEKDVESVHATVAVDSLNYRVSGPRKLNVRTRLRAKPCVHVKEELAWKQSPAGEIEGLCTLPMEMDSLHTRLLSSGEISVSEGLDIGKDTRPVWCGSTAAVRDARAMEGGVSVRGDICVKVMTEAKVPTFVYKKLPFEAFLDGEVHKGDAVTAVASVLSTEVTAGKDGDAYADVILQVDATVDTPCKVEIAADAFSTAAMGRTEYRMLPTARLLLAHSGQHTVGGSISKAAAGASGLAKVLDTAGEATCVEATLADGKLTLHGKCNLNTVYAEESGAVGSAEYMLPFALVLDCEAAEPFFANAEVAFLSARVRADGENLVCDMDISVCVRVRAQGEARAVSGVDFDGAKPHETFDYPLTVIYPNGETLWNVAKQYHRSPESLAALNAVPCTPGELIAKNVLILEN